MPTNFYMYFLVGLIPMIIGSVWYNPKVMGTAWMNSNGFKEEDLQGANMAMIFGFSYLFSVMLAFFMTSMVIHQHGVVSSAMESSGVWTPEGVADVNAFMATYGNNFRTFGHGAVHGLLITLFVALPLLAIHSLFERRSWKYILIHLGYWAICLILMGGVLCSTLEFAPLTAG